MVLSASALTTYWVATFVIMVTPGITVTSLLGTTLALGSRAGLSMEIGVDIARLSMLILLALGLTAIGTFVAEAYTVIKLIGAAYLVWLGIKAIRHPPDISGLDVVQPAMGSLVLRGIAVVWSNPKALLFFGALIPQFIDTNAPLAPQLMVLGAIWIVTGTLTDSLYILLSGRIRTIFSKTAGRALGWVSGSVLIGAALWLATSQKA